MSPRTRPLGTLLTVAAAMVMVSVLAFPAAGLAQLSSASAAALGMGENYTGVARGFNALAWNPANLGLPGNPGFSLAIPSLRLTAGLDPIGLSDLADFEGRVIPDDVKARWLDEITREGSQEGGAGAGGGVAVSVWKIAAQVSGELRGVVELGPQAAELLLFGNAGRTGQPRDLGLEGSNLDVAAWTTAAVGFAIPLRWEIGPVPRSRFAVGAALKYTIGHLLIHGEDMGSLITADPLRADVDFPIVQTDTATEEFNNGTGIGVDIGAAWQGAEWTLSVAVQNVVNTFEWDEEKLFFRPGEALWDAEQQTSNFDAQPLSQVPPQLRAFLESFLDDQKFRPRLLAGVAYDLTPNVTLSGDFQQQFGEGIRVGPKTHVGVGAELRVPVLVLRAGLAVVTSGFQFGGGAGLHLGPVNLSGSIARRSSDLGSDTIGMVSLTFGAG